MSSETANPLQAGLDMIDMVWNQNLTSPIRRLTVFFSYRWVSSKEDYGRVLDAINAVLKPIGTMFEQAKSHGLLEKTITVPLVLDLISAAHLHALQEARFGEDERKAAKKKFDGQVDYLLQIDRANFIG
ncbi:MAG: hypothetical protein L3J65_00360 [Robiginitomaculum sp.]|nr:hypothetical protein [Robiginitomaculum sp.]